MTLPEGSRPEGCVRPRVKICGVTSAAEAVLAADLGADLIGLNFFPPSPRYLEPQRAAEIAAAVRGRAGGAQMKRGRAGGAPTKQRRAGGAQMKQVKLVGVFVNSPRRQVEEIAAGVGLDLLQFHGDETPAAVAPFAKRAIKAFRVRDQLDPQSLAGFDGIWGVLIDSRHPRLYGGSGESWRFESLPELDEVLPRRTFIAGGLGPANVRAAITAARPYGIDLCSGVEGSPGKKDPELLRRLFEEIRNGETSTAA